MLPLPSLLRRAFALCNRFGKPIGVIAVVIGIGVIASRSLLMGSVSTEFLAQTQALIGPQGFSALEQQVEEGKDMEQVSTLFMSLLAEKLTDIPEEQRNEYLYSIAVTSFARIAPVVVPLAILLLIFNVFARTAFLVIAARKAGEIGGVLRQSSKAFFPVIGAWIGMWLCAGIWVPFAVFLIGFVWPPILYLAFPSLAPLIVWLPRFALAPVIVVEEKKTVTAALRASYQRTRGKWWDVLTAVLAMEAVLWVILTLIGSLLTALVQSVAQFSELGYALYWLMPFIALLAVAYRQAFMVEVKEAIGA